MLKHLKINRFYFILISIALPFSAFATDNLHVKPFTQEDGLPNNLIYDIKKDMQGYLWVGTYKGLARYDGKVWKNYTGKSTHSSIISSNHITSLHIDSENHIWIGTHKNGLNKFNQQKQTFEHFLPSLSISDISDDADQSIWVGTTNNGVYHLKPNGEVIKQYLATSQILSVSKIADKIYIGTQQSGLMRLDNNRFTTISPLSVNDILNQKSNPELLWLASNSGLHLLNTKNDQQESFLSQYWITNIDYRNDNELWVATESSGLILFDIGSKTILQHLQNTNTRQGKVADNHIKSLFVDESGITWIGTAGGINRIVSKPFRTYRFSSLTSNGITNNYIRSFTEDREGNIWIGSWGGGISMLNPTSGEFTNFPSDFNSALRVAKLLYTDKNHTLWTAGDSGLNAFDIHNISWANIPLLNNNINILSLTQTSKGLFLIATEKNGLIIFNPSTRKIVEHYSSDANNQITLPSNTILHAAEVNEEKILISTANGISFLDLALQQINSLTLQQSVLFSLQDKKKQIWLNLSGKLNILHDIPNSEPRFKNLENVLNISLNIVTPILEDPLGYLWFATEKNLYRHNPNNNGLLTFDLVDNLPYRLGTERAAYYATKSNTIYIANTFGFISIDPYKIQPSLLNPPVHIQTVKVDGVEYASNETIKLSGENNNIEFEFVSLDYKDPNKIQYAYRLDGIDQDWIYSENQNHAIYSDLPRGSYTFSVKATNADGHWGNNIASINIRVTQTFNAYLSYALIFLCVIISGIVVLKGHRRRSEVLIDALPDETQTVSEESSGSEGPLPELIASSINANLATKDSKFLKQLNDCVSNNYQDNNFGIKQVSHELCTTERPLQKKLKATLGMTLTSYIRVYRLEKAAELLRNNREENSKQLYEKVGFSSQAYFITCFKAHFGITPKHYVKQFYKASVLSNS